MTGVRHRWVGAPDMSRPCDPERAPIDSLSVVIPCRNGRSLLGRQLTALAAQAYDGWFEVIVADNGSRDGSPEVAEQWRRRLPHLEIVAAGERRGAAWARNVASATAGGEGLVFLDHDDGIAPGYLDAMAKALADHDIVAAKVDHVTLNPGLPRAKWHWQSQGLMEGLGFLPCAGAGTIGVRRSVFEALGGFDPELRCAEDLDFCWRAQLAGFDLFFAPDAVLHYAYRSGLIGHFSQEWQWGFNDVLLYARYRARGMPRRPAGVLVRDWLRLAARLAGVRNRAELSACLGMLGRRLGRIAGSTRGRTLYL